MKLHFRAIQDHQFLLTSYIKNIEAKEFQRFQLERNEVFAPNSLPTWGLENVSLLSYHVQSWKVSSCRLMLQKKRMKKIIIITTKNKKQNILFMSHQFNSVWCLGHFHPQLVQEEVKNRNRIFDVPSKTQ